MADAFITKMIRIQSKRVLKMGDLNLQFERRQAHSLLDAIPDEKIVAARSLLEKLVDPVSRAIADAPDDDEPESKEERLKVIASKAWLAEHPGHEITEEEILGEFGLTPKDLKR
jgi:hypothetical protein